MSDNSLHVDKPVKPRPSNPRASLSAVDSDAFTIPNVEIPAAIRDVAEKGAAQVKDNFERLQTATEQAARAVEATFATSAKGVTDYALKLIDMARANANLALEFGGKLAGVKSPSGAVELATEHARRQYETLSKQNTELLALVQKIATDATESMRKLRNT